MLSNFCYVVAYGRFKTKENFKVERRLLTRGSKNTVVTYCETFGILENWSLRTDGRSWDMVGTGGLTVLIRLRCFWNCTQQRFVSSFNHGVLFQFSEQLCWGNEESCFKCTYRHWAPSPESTEKFFGFQRHIS